jgi:hypothetical protein
MADEERPTEPIPPRWSGSAPIPPVDPYDGPLDPYDRGLVEDRTLDMPPEELPRARPPAVWTPPPGWAPPGWVPPPGWVRVRRRRWPWVLLVITMLTVGCCCACPAYLARPFFDQYPASVSLPAEAAGLVRLDDADSRQVAQDLRRRVRSEYWFVDDVFAGVYRSPGQDPITLAGATRFILDPAGDLESGLGKLSKLAVTDVRAAGAGPLGGELSCGNAGSGKVVCGWADHGSIGVGVFPGRSTTESAQLLRDLRAAIVTRT